jgi:hypothetical protein
MCRDTSDREIVLQNNKQPKYPYRYFKLLASIVKRIYPIKLTLGSQRYLVVVHPALIGFGVGITVLLKSRFGLDFLPLM